MCCIGLRTIFAGIGVLLSPPKCVEVKADVSWLRILLYKNVVIASDISDVL